MHAVTSRATRDYERDDLTMTTITIARTTAVCALALTTALAGCARRPSVTSTAAAPGGPPAAAAPAAADSAAPAIVVEEQREVLIVERPDPASFTENANVKPIYFDFDQYEIRAGDARTLEMDASWLRTNDMLILIEGQCDERGTDAYNLALGDRRARAAMNYLMAHGVAGDRISIVSYGKERPVCTEHTEACWALNRRANILVKPRG
jgi:peptidoglycan-associated lipoprotein